MGRAGGRNTLKKASKRRKRPLKGPDFVPEGIHSGRRAQKPPPKQCSTWNTRVLTGRPSYSASCQAAFGFSSKSASNATSAGVTPLILPACPSVAGRSFASFCRVSERSPRTRV